MKRSERYARIPWALLMDTKITAEAKLVYAVLAGHAHQGAVASVGQRRIARMLAMGLATVSRKIAELENAAYIKTEHGGAGRRSWYELLSPVFGQKQGRVDVVVSAPRGKRLVSVEKIA